MLAFSQPAVSSNISLLEEILHTELLDRTNKKKIENLPGVLVCVRIGNGFLDRRGNKKYIEGWKKLQNYLYENKFTSYFEKQRNMLGMYVITYSPKWVRSLLYSKLVRKEQLRNENLI